MYQSYSSHPSQHYATPPPTNRPQSTYQQGGYGGYQQRQSYHASTPQPPPSAPKADPLWHYFSSVDKDRSGAISVTELQSALVNGDWTRFDLDTVKMLMNMFDADRSGTIGFSEFKGLWKYIADWQGVFRHFDSDRSGSIEGRELSDALRSFGYNLSPGMLTLIEHKYASQPTVGYGPPPGITFDRFVRACVVVKTLTEAFQRVDTNNDGWAELSYEQFMQIVLSAP
ncbi:hypothetical protein BDV98DRAFT_539310 [Pterulicium gracile]|uniref:EF-hand domain-containing protein n=1 Tax=Pterulicium gracile TaxID=1884261 RepID=A0A5C3QZR1_9AGAR|nr:hypothetical protein BDV98DRAFT_539310 [Pterula gracilis]